MPSTPHLLASWVSWQSRYAHQKRLQGVGCLRMSRLTTLVGPQKNQLPKDRRIGGPSGTISTVRALVQLIASGTSSLPYTPAN